MQPGGQRAAWVIEEGAYRLLLGNSSKTTSSVGIISIEESISAEQCANRLGLAACNRGKVKFLTQRESGAAAAGKINSSAENGRNVLHISTEDVRRKNEKPGHEKNAGNLSDLSIEELAALCVGYGPGTPFAAVGDRSDPSTIFDEKGNPLTVNSHPTGYPGYVSPAIEKKGIRSVFYKDGPAGIGGIAWPAEMLIACSFDRKIWRMFGEAVGAECEEQKVNVWLAPAVNLHRNPLCGRNFEYFSEDPYLTGVCACEITKGVQEGHAVIVCPKHFAVNEQETFRRGNAGRQTPWILF